MQDARDAVSICGSGRFPGVGNGNPLQGSHFEKFHRQRSLWTSQVVQVVKNLPANAGDIRVMGSIPGLGRYPGEGYGNQLQYCYLEN